MTCGVPDRAEGSLEMSEYLLHEKLGLSKPAWINQEDYDNVIASVLFTENQRTGEGISHGRRNSAKSVLECTSLRIVPPHLVLPCLQL